MPIVFEPTKDYGKLRWTLYQTLARRCLLGKKFGSLEEALCQKDPKGKSLLEYGFYIGDITVEKPENLPIVINEVTIFVKAHFEKQHASVSSHLPILEARFVED